MAWGGLVLPPTSRLLWPLRLIFDLYSAWHFSQCREKCCAKATSSALAPALPPRWRPKPRHLQILSCHLVPSFPPQDTQISEASARGVLRIHPQGLSAGGSAGLGGIPAHLVIPAGESPPPVPVTPGREFPPLESTRGRESPPIQEVRQSPSAAQLGEQGLERALGAGACGPGQRGAVGGCGGDPPGRGRPGLRLRWLRASSGAAALGAAVAPAVAAVAAAAWGPTGRRLGPDARGAASAEPRAGEATVPLRPGRGASGGWGRRGVRLGTPETSCAQESLVTNPGAGIPAPGRR